jgi:hypothetical protein
MLVTVMNDTNAEGYVLTDRECLVLLEAFERSLVAPAVPSVPGEFHG